MTRVECNSGVTGQVEEPEIEVTRSNPRVIKRKYVKWHVKRAHHANWPQPTHVPAYQILTT